MSRSVSFVKMQGVGNDFVLLDARSQELPDYPELAIRLCDRRTGIGADGLMVVESEAGYDARKRFFNPDGTEDFCGNGIRCFARYVAERAGKRTVRLATLVGDRFAEVRLGGDPSMVRVSMGKPTFEPGDLPTSAETPIVKMPVPVCGETLALTSVNTGSLHTVVFVDELPDDERFIPISRALEHHDLFPERTSVMWTVVESASRFRIRIWERGVGETQGCGTGACAVVAVSHHLGIGEARAEVRSAGGSLHIEISEDGTLMMTGPAQAVFAGTVWV